MPPVRRVRVARVPKLVVYEDRAEEWRWTLESGNGEPIADSAEGYTRRAEVGRAIARVRRAAARARIVER
jgi:uncharacterized protein YegP (UPF0339 family)